MVGVWPTVDSHYKGCGYSIFSCMAGYLAVQVVMGVVNYGVVHVVGS